MVHSVGPVTPHVLLRTGGREAKAVAMCNLRTMNPQEVTVGGDLDGFTASLSLSLSRDAVSTSPRFVSLASVEVIHFRHIRAFNCN